IACLGPLGAERHGHPAAADGVMQGAVDAARLEGLAEDSDRVRFVDRGRGQRGQELGEHGKIAQRGRRAPRGRRQPARRRGARAAAQCAWLGCRRGTRARSALRPPWRRRRPPAADGPPNSIGNLPSPVPSAPSWPRRTPPTRRPPRWCSLRIMYDNAVQDIFAIRPTESVLQHGGERFWVVSSLRPATHLERPPPPACGEMCGGAPRGGAGAWRGATGRGGGSRRRPKNKPFIQVAPANIWMRDVAGGGRPNKVPLESE